MTENIRRVWMLIFILPVRASLRTCPRLEPNSICVCSSSSNGINLACQGNETLISIGILPFFPGMHSFQQVKIDCQYTDSAMMDYNTLPKIGIDIFNIDIRNCPLSLHRHEDSIFHRLKITASNRLIVDSSGPVSRAHFERFEDLDTLILTNLTKRRFDLPLDVFFSLQSMESLTISDTNLVHLPDGVFQNLELLTELNLGHNNLSHLTKESFQGCSSLKSLNLESNNLVTLPSDVFSHLEKLEIVKLSGNHFQSLPEGLFGTNKRLLSFDLVHNKVALKELPAKLFADLPRLEKVNLTCGLVSINEDLFTKSTSIEIIDISGNKLTALPTRLFAHQFELTYLDLSGNQLKTLSDGTFSQTRKLIKLRLSHNHLEAISRHTFSPLHLLESLFLDNNSLHDIDATAFHNNEQLSYLFLENNRLDSMPYLLYTITTFQEKLGFFSEALRAVNLRNNSIRTIRRGRFQYMNLQTLDLSYNQIAAVTSADLDFKFHSLYLNLSHNFIFKIDFSEAYPETDDCANIGVDLSSNPIDCSCEMIPFVNYLQGGHKKRCLRLEKVSETKCLIPKVLEGRVVSDLSAMELLCPFDDVLNLTKLCPEPCACWARPADGIIVVDCSNLELTEVPVISSLVIKREGHTFKGIELHIENNRITYLPSVNGSGYMHVVELNASNNSLAEFFVGNLPQNLRVLNLSRNKIQRLDDTVLNILKANQIQVTLAGNPWICDCDSQGLLNFVQLHHNSITDFNQTTCSDGRTLFRQSLSTICPGNTGLIIAGCVLVATVGLFAAFYYKYQQEIKIWLYARGMCLWFVSEEDLDKDKRYDAFISYSHKDEDFVTDCLLPELEAGPTPFKLCVHIRDWVIGEFIPNQIVQSVAESRRTIIVMSPNFIESVWGRLEFRTAHTAALSEGRARVIVVILGEVPDIDSLDPELKAYLQMNTYIKWGDPWFWKKLRYAMPHSSRDPLPSDNELVLIEPSTVNIGT